jgi:hypothetical protein
LNSSLVVVGDGIDTPMDLDSDEEDECNQGNVAAGAACSSTSVHSQLPFTYMALLKEKCRSKMGSGMFTSGTIKVLLLPFLLALYCPQCISVDFHYPHVY